MPSPIRFLTQKSRSGKPCRRCLGAVPASMAAVSSASERYSTVPSSCGQRTLSSLITCSIDLPSSRCPGLIRVSEENAQTRSGLHGYHTPVVGFWMGKYDLGRSLYDWPLVRLKLAQSPLGSLSGFA